MIDRLSANRNTYRFRKLRARYKQSMKIVLHNVKKIQFCQRIVFCWKSSQIDFKILFISTTLRSFFLRVKVYDFLRMRVKNHTLWQVKDVSYIPLIVVLSNVQKLISQYEDLLTILKHWLIINNHVTTITRMSLARRATHYCVIWHPTHM